MSMSTVGGLLFPGVVGAEVPEVAFGIARAVESPAVGLVFDFKNDFGSGSFSVFVMGVYFIDNDIHTPGIPSGLGGALDRVTVFPVGR